MIDYEKKYNEALERAKHALDCDKAGLVTTDRVLIESMFPELQESENEKIRKALIDYFDDAIKADVNPLQSYGTHPNKVIDWLEKQKALDKEIIFRPLVGTDIIVAAKQALEKIEIGKEVILAFNGAYIPVNGKTVAEICNEYFAWHEKQGEEKAIGMKSSEESLGVSSKEYNEIVNECLYGESKPTDKVEPKFKVGDWVLYSGDHYEGVRHITKIDENGYYIERNGLPHGIIPFEHEICMTLWTIQDAKDGDVLAESKNDVILMFRGIGNTEWDDVIDYHCYYDCYRKDFIVQEDVKYWGTIANNHLKPASKEQRNILFQKMKEEGYEWDAEKKELKKIDTVQPKFKVGDWIANDYCTGKVIALTDDAYLLDSGQGIPFSCEHNAHLWTIRDAKDGDVLAFSNDTIVIFKNLYNSTTFHSYCHIEDGVFNVSKDDVPDWWEGKGFYPATKEQREILMKAMTDADYQWDAEKKELKKIGESENIKNQIMSEITDLVKDYIRQKSTCDNEDGDIIIFSK